MFTVIGVTGTWIVPNQPIICMLLNAIGSILLICCWIHDIVLVYQDKSNQKKETKNKKLDVLEIVLIILVIGIPMVSIAGFISSLMAYIPQLDDTSDHMVEQEPIYEIVFDDIPVHLSDLGVPVEGVESCEMTPGGNGMGLLESYQYETFCLDESEEEVIASCEYTVYTSESSMMINRFASEKIRDPGGKELSQKICDHWKAEKIIQFDNELYIIYEKAILQWNYKDKLTQEQIDTVLSLLHQTYKNIPQ